jgi:hypothetical protein
MTSCISKLKSNESLFVVRIDICLLADDAANPSANGIEL